MLSTSSPASTHDRNVSQMLWMLLSPSTHCAITEISPAGVLCGSEAASRSGLSRPAVAVEGGGVRPCARAPSSGALFLLRARMPASPASAVCSPSEGAGVRARGAPRGGNDLARSISPSLALRLARARLAASHGAVPRPGKVVPSLRSRPCLRLSSLLSSRRAPRIQGLREPHRRRI